ncbi:MAG TPA: hypothetical protein DEA08_10610, partial [Planctomycetes bacterium]|nr:hypothetical protein [Planctomycetota bacterium]
MRGGAGRGESVRWEARWLDRRKLGPRKLGLADEREPKGAKRGPTRREAPLAARLGSEEEARALVARLAGQPGRVVEVTRREERVPPPLLHHLTSLQQEANRRYGLTADQTLQAAQALYEKRKLITYPRTDSRHLTRDVAAGLRAVVAAVACGPYAQAAQGLLAGGLPPLGRRYVDDAKVGDHHAIVPTASAPNLDALPQREARVYDLIVRRFLAAFHPPAIYARSRIDAEVAGELLRANGRVRLDPGWEA